MREINSITKLRKIIQQAKRQGKTIGFVPTMGYFHDGHLSLMRSSRKDNDITVVSIYVNPLQFGKTEDFSSYPRDLKKDKILAKAANIDIIFYPSDKEMYPEEQLTAVDVENLTKTLCGRFRLGHFRGVATVVAKLLNIVTPDIMYLGQKDAQQVGVIKKMVADLNFPVRIKVVKTAREKDGLAMSSRNAYLSAGERTEAPIIYRTLVWAKNEIISGERRPDYLMKAIRRRIEASSRGKVQYVECVDTKSLQPLKKIQGEVLIAAAVYFGKTRLIDNLIVHI